MSFKPSRFNASSAIKSTTRTPGKRIVRGARYAELLAEAQPVLPRTLKENRRLLRILDRLIDKGASRTAEESALAEVLVTLISRFEQERYRPAKLTPNELLRALMEENNLRQRELLDVFPTRSRVSEVLAGKRGITREQAAALGARFSIDPAAFIEWPA